MAAAGRACGRWLGGRGVGGGGWVWEQGHVAGVVAWVVGVLVAFGGEAALAAATWPEWGACGRWPPLPSAGEAGGCGELLAVVWCQWGVAWPCAPVASP